MESLSQENRKFSPVPQFVNQAKIAGMDAYKEQYKKSIENPSKYWSSVANELHWFKPWDKVLDESNAPFYQWFTNAKTNISYNCLDRQVELGKGDKVAFYWEGEPGDKKAFTYKELLEEVCRFANVLKSFGVKKGDRIALYLPMIPELVFAVLACARIGAVHSVIFAGFSSESIRDRVEDCQTRMIITADGGYRRGKVLELKKIVDEGIANCNSISEVLVIKRGGDLAIDCPMSEGRDFWYDTLSVNCSHECPAEEMDSEDLLFLLYTSGTTGKPKGIMHTTAGYQVFSYITSKYVFDLNDDDVYWCTADVGWITGHTYIVYGILQNGATQLIYEGAPNHPDPARFWNLIEDYKVTTFYTAPTAIRAFMKWGDHWLEGKDLSSLRLLGSVGEPINPEAWMWYHKKIGASRCPIVDTWWQTETGGHLLTPLPGAIPTKPGCATVPFFGIEPLVLNEEGEEVDVGILAIKNPWPGMLRGIYGDEQRYIDTYWSKWNGRHYFPGDGARIDEDGYYWILGRVDDVVNVSGHRIGTAELESIFVEHESIAEAAVIGIKHEIKGQGLLAFATVIQGKSADEELQKDLIQLVDKRIGKFARPEKIIFSSDLPKTRSGKIMRRLLRSIADGDDLGNITTLADPSVVDEIQKQFNQ
ncbi:MAG: acetate--CoA ligase [Opitutales bacterium TMED207]|nr:acetate--CoA ligase [Puniceicoccaceae bacterium]RPG15197.1 MAG: acetate--CoA ligase [Opitutales bacterium TMED207]|tara:strand:+ start:15957 stop:17897 length:1941 start_codon:yes stop_codon:yes gene_type:complete